MVDWSARYPQAVHLLGDHWDDLLSHAGGRRFGLAALRALRPPPDAAAGWTAAKEFWVAHVARLRHRRDVARTALRAAAAARPPFAPAMRAFAGWDREELGLTAKDRAAEVERLAASVEGQDRALAEELRGVALLS